MLHERKEEREKEREREREREREKEREREIDRQELMAFPKPSTQLEPVKVNVVVEDL